MTYLRKLSINGIRSYNPNKVSRIDFLSPITVIVGRNGSGKTSIIEALKYICTGSLPPESQSGKNFVCDRKLGTSTTIDATIELEFLAPDNKIITATRNFKTITSATRKTFKAVDGVLKTVDGDGNIVTGSHTVTNFDKIVPLLFKSNKSILENVVFCHQEDSLWPLSDPASLKTKFDYIFCSSKLNKSLETVLKTKKHNESQYKDEMITYEKTRILKDQYLNINTEMESLNKSIRDCLEHKTSITECKKKVKEVIDKIDNKIRRINEIKEELKNLESNKLQIISNIEFLKEGLGSVDLDNEYSDISEIENELKKNKKDLECIEENKKKIEIKIQDLYKKKGMLESIESTLKDKRIKYDELISKCFINLEGKSAESILKMKTKDYEETAKKFRDKLAHIQNEINDKKNKTAILLSYFENTKGKVLEIKKEKKEVNNKFRLHLKNLKKGEELDIQEANRIVSKLKLKTKMINTELQTIENNIQKNESLTIKNNKGLEDAFEFLKQSKEVETKQENITYVKKTIASLSEQRVLKVSEIKQVEFYINNSEKAKYKDIFTQLSIILNRTDEALKVLDTETKLIKELTSMREEKESNLKKLNLNMNSVETENKLINKQVSEKEIELEKIKQNKKAKESTIKKLGFGKAKLKSLCNVEHRIKELESSDFISGLLSESEANNKCGFCELKFPNKTHIKKLKTKYDLDDEGKKEEINKLTRIKETLKEISDSETIIEQLERTIKEGKSNVSANIEKIKGMKKVIEMYETKANDLKKIISKLYKINELTKASFNSENELNNILKSYDIDQDAFDVTEITNIENGIKSKNKQNEEILKENKKFKEESENLKRKLEEKTKQLNVEEALLEKYNLFKKKISEMNLSILLNYNENRQLNKVLYKNKDIISSLKETEKEIESEKEYKLKDKQNKIDELRNISCLKEESDELTTQRDSLLYCIDKIKNKNGKLNKLNENKKTISQKIENLQTLAKNLEIRNKIDNLEQNVAKLNTDIKSTKQLLGAKEPLEALEEKMKNHSGIMDELNSKVNSLQGRISEQENQIGRLRKQLEAEQLQNINEKYRVSFVKMQFFQKAAAELKQLHKDLEYSLMTYHSTKMKEVNEVLVDLWRSVYTGSDIEYIWIDSKNEMSTGTTSKRAASSYNYSIVMMQNRKFLPLKGRCSAGQKVLASLLIRLALSEVFCSECGILALDEPTTNLDDDNIEALAEAIIRVIQRRISQGDFQMILITHDEKFVEKLRVSGAFDEYYRVFKDSYQFSNIKKRNVYNQ